MNVIESRIVDIAVVDDHPIVRNGLQGLLEGIPFINQVLLFSSSHQLFEALPQRSVDAVLMDIELRGENGLDACSTLKKVYPDLPVVIFSSHTEGQYVWKAHKSGASGYVFKDAEVYELANVLEQIIFNGGRYFSTDIMGKVSEFERKAQQPINNFGQIFTPRELEILFLICEGYSSKAIAEKLILGESTINTHRKSLHQKTGAHNAIELKKFAEQNGIFPSFEL